MERERERNKIFAKYQEVNRAERHINKMMRTKEREGSDESTDTHTQQ